MTVVLFLMSFVVILSGCELFVNSVEWFGRRLDLGEGAVGSVLAAVGTALPETIIPIIAIAAGGTAGVEVGTGAILGAPFMLSTLAMFVCGSAVVIFSLTGSRSRTVRLNRVVLNRDLSFFLVVYSVGVLVGVVHLGPIKHAVALPAAGSLRRVRVPHHEVRGGPAGRDSSALLPRGGRVAHAAAHPAATLRGPLCHRPWGRPLRARADQAGGGSVRVASGHLAVADAHRHRVAREVQQRHVDAPAQGHPGSRQYHRRHGLPERHPGRRGGGVHAVATRLVTGCSPPGWLWPRALFCGSACASPAA